MPELSDSIKTLNLRIVGIEEEKMEAKGACNTFSKILAENFPNLKKVLSIQGQEASKTPDRTSS
jgi:hypothetical protein